MAFVTEILSPQTSHRLMVDDNDRVAFAYLLDGEQIIADVWLYNRASAPVEPEWNSPYKMPFTNPRGYAKDEPFVPIENEDDIEVRWYFGHGSLEKVDIFIRGNRHACLRPGSKPGWCVLAIKDGPLARILQP